MKGIKKNIEAYLNDNAGKIINEMGKKKGDTFSTHDFIFQLLRHKNKGKGEDEYIKWLSEQASRASRFGAVNSQIGIYLSACSADLGIGEHKRDDTLNIKGYETGNQVWKIR